MICYETPPKNTLLLFPFGSNDATGAAITATSATVICVAWDDLTTAITAGITTTLNVLTGTYGNGSHVAAVDTSNAAYTSGKAYIVYLVALTVDGVSVKQPLGTFNLGAWTPTADVTKWLGTAPATPTVAGVPVVDLVLVQGDLQHGLDFHDFLENGYDASTNNLTDSRLANLDATVSSRASQAEVLSIQNNTRVVRVVPSMIERPDSGTQEYRIELLLYDTVGNMEAPDSAPTIALVDQGGTDLSSRLDSATMALVSTGRYRAIYTASDTDDLEQLVWAFSVIEGGNTRIYGNTTIIVDTTAVDFTSADRTVLQAAATQLSVNDLPTTAEFEARTLAAASYATATNQTTILNRLGAWTGTGVNTLLGAFKALLSKVASVPSDIGGTFDPATDSTEAISELAEFVKAVEEGDHFVDKTTNPAQWQLVITRKGTLTELIRKDINDVDGVALVSTDTVRAQFVEP